MSLRSKRLTSPLHPEASAFLDSTSEDAALVRDDVLGTLVHVAVLEEGKILTAKEAQSLREALAELYATTEQFTLSREYEDVHMNVEAWLTERVGDLGMKIHTGRSRNDQVALDLRLWTRRALLELGYETHRLAQALLTLAEDHPHAVLPGHTHFQIAQPVLFSHHLGAHVARLVRDLGRTQEAYARVNVSPLGAGALAGTSHPIHPELSAKLLAFDAAFQNSLDAVSDRDFVHESLYVQAMILNHVSSLAEEFVLFSHPAFGFVQIDDAHATGSSIMPQKKNPDVLEVARAKAATAVGALTASLAQTRALPLAYNRDYQEQKRLFLKTVPAGIETVRVVTNLVEGVSINEEAMKTLAGLGHSDATDLADYLVRKGVPFRQAHAQAARCVQRALAEEIPLAKLPLAKYQAVNPLIGKDVYACLGAAASVATKTSPGGTAPERVRESLDAFAHSLAHHRAFLDTQAQTIRNAEANLLVSTQTVNAR